MGRIITVDAPGASGFRPHEYCGRFGDWLAEHFPDGPCGRAHQAVLNGEVLAVEDYNCAEIGEDDELALVFTPAGFDPLTVAIIVAVSVAASVAISLLLSPVDPGNIANDDPASVYSVNQQANTARLGGIIPASYGRSVWTPDYASQSYRFFDSNDETRLFLLSLGHGVVDVDGLRLGDTAVSELPDGLVEWQVFHPDDHQRRIGPVGAAFGMHENVVTSGDVSQQELGGRFKFQDRARASFSGDTITFEDGSIASRAKQGDRLVVRKSPANGDYIVASVDGSAVRVTTALSGSGNGEFDLAILSGASTTLGPFSANPSGTVADRIELDVELPGGLHNRDDEGNLQDWTIELTATVQPIDDEGEAAGAAFTRTFAETAATVDPQRRTYVISGLTPARYQVSLRRTDFQELERETDRTIWSGLKAFLVDDGSPAYGEVSLLAVRITAAQALSGSSQNKIFAVTKRLIEPFDGGAPVFSANPADVIADMVRDPRYGAAQSVDRLSADGFAAFRASQQSRSGFNGVFDQETTLFEAMKAVCLVGYAQPMPLGARLTIVEDGPRPVRRSIVTPDNIATGSFKLDVLFRGEGRHDGYLVEYSDRETFGKREALWPDQAIRPKRVRVRGMTDDDEALSLARYFWLQEQLRNVDVSFAMEWDALSFARLDRVGVAFPLFDWGAGSQLASHHGSALTVTRGTVPDGDCWVCLRDQDGRAGEVLAASGDGAKTLTLAAEPDVELVCDGRSVSTLIAWGQTEDFLRDVSIESVRPAGPRTQVTAKFYTPQLFEGRI